MRHIIPSFHCSVFPAFALLSLLVAGSPLATAGVVQIQLPPETASFKPGAGSDLANAHCLTCHSVEYVAMQPPFPAAFWTAEIKKMREKYAASIPEEQTATLVSYLANTYGVATNGPASATPVPPPNLRAGTVEQFAALYGCLSCHKIDTKLVGPAFKDVAAKYRTDPAPLEKIMLQIHNGGSGKWGSVVMPPFATMSDAQAKELAQWIMSQK